MELYSNYPELLLIKESIEKAIGALIECYTHKGKVLVCGNGGSAADSEHIVGELMKGFLLTRPVVNEKMSKELSKNLQEALPAIALTGSIALSTAFANDVNSEYVFAQQVYGLGESGDVLIALSTSGNAKNVGHAVEVAKAKGMVTIGMTGELGGNLMKICDIIINAPSKETYRVQEFHLPIYHEICARVEKFFFGKI